MDAKQNTVDADKCLACGAKIGLLRSFSKQRFCSEKHEQQHIEELHTIALRRLQETEERLLASLKQRSEDEIAGVGYVAS